MSLEELMEQEKKIFGVKYTLLKLENHLDYPNYEGYFNDLEDLLKCLDEINFLRTKIKEGLELPNLDSELPQEPIDTYFESQLGWYGEAIDWLKQLKHNAKINEGKILVKETVLKSLENELLNSLHKNFDLVILHYKVFQVSEATDGDIVFGMFYHPNESCICDAESGEEVENIIGGLSYNGSEMDYKIEIINIISSIKKYTQKIGLWCEGKPLFETATDFLYEIISTESAEKLLLGENYDISLIF